MMISLLTNMGWGISIFPPLIVVLLWKYGTAGPRSAYIHVPFCRRRCYYCNFPVQIIGDRKVTIERESAAYTDILLKDIENAVRCSGSTDTHPLDTIYFGGGTPSMLTNECISRILTEIRCRFSISSTAEITLEMDPGTFDEARVLELKKIGINRVSMGVQSFDDTILKACGRAHSSEEVIAAISALTSAGMENFSIDLISSLPKMGLKEWSETLHMACSFRPPHISIYDLQVEERTAFGRWYSPGQFPLPTEEVSADMYRLAVRILTREYGYEHYEVSNYAQPGRRSQHNQKYWKNEPFWGFGMGAASYLNGKRVTRPSTMTEYVSWVEAIHSGEMAMHPSPLLTATGNASVTVEEEEEERILEVIMLSLRTKDGLNLTTLKSEHRKAVIDALLPYYRYRDIDGQYYSDSTDDVRTDDHRELVQFFFDQSTTDDNNDGISLLSASVRAVEQEQMVPVGDDNGERRREWRSRLHDSVTGVRLVDPDGFLLSNDIISSVFAAIMS